MEEDKVQEQLVDIQRQIFVLQIVLQKFLFLNFSKRIENKIETT